MVDSNNNDNIKNNVEFIYSYTQNLIAEFDNGIDSLNRKLTAFLGFSGIFLGFAIKLSQNHLCPSSLLTKSLAIGLASLAALSAGFGLLTDRVGGTRNPKTLLDNKDAGLTDLQEYVIDKWVESIGEYRKRGSAKQHLLNRSIRFLMAAVVLAMTNIMLGIFLNECLTPKI